MSESTSLLPRNEPQVINAHQEPDLKASLQAVATTNLYFNIIGCTFLPLGFLAEILSWSDTAIFSLNMVAIVSLAKMLDLATDQLSNRLGQTLGAVSFY